MKHSRVIGLVIIISMILTTVLAACGGSAATPDATGTAAATETGSASGDPIKIGGVFNLTGGMSSIDVPGADGAKLAVKEINEAGGLLGRPVELVVLDAKTDVTTSSTVATQLTDVEKVVGMVGLNDSTFAVAAGQVAQTAGIPYIVCGATTPQMPEMVGENLFMLSFGDTVQGAAAAEFTYNDLGVKNVWVMYDKGMDYARGLAQYFKVRYQEMGGTIVAEDIYQTGDTDYSSQITKLKSLNPQPEALFISSGPDEIGTIIKQVRDAGITLPIIGGDGYDTPLLAELAGPENSNDIYFTTHLGLANDTEIAKAFKDAYKAEYGKDLDSVFGALGYDSVKLVANAIERAGSDDPAAIRAALAETANFEGVTGELSYPDDSRIPQKSVAVVKLVDGKVVFDTDIVPEKVPAP